MIYFLRFMHGIHTHEYLRHLKPWHLCHCHTKKRMHIVIHAKGPFRPEKRFIEKHLLHCKTYSNTTHSIDLLTSTKVNYQLGLSYHVKSRSSHVYVATTAEMSCHTLMDNYLEKLEGTWQHYEILKKWYKSKMKQLDIDVSPPASIISPILVG